MTDYFYRQAIELIDEGVDAIAFETSPARLEARCVLRALDRLPSSCTAWISFSCKVVVYAIQILLHNCITIDVDNGMSCL
jgi:S-methylmethionine-dependent homocysteine/selenocysteine methylase